MNSVIATLAGGGNSARRHTLLYQIRNLLGKHQRPTATGLNRRWSMALAATSYWRAGQVDFGVGIISV